MRHEYRRCTHCGVRYTYQSGGRCDNPLNHNYWCPDCYQVVRTALAGVPRRYELRYRDIREIPRYVGVTIERMLTWEAIDDALRGKLRAEGRVVGVRVYSPLFNLKTGDSQHVREVQGHEEFEGHLFVLSTWRHNPGHAPTVTVDMEYDLVEGGFTDRLWSGPNSTVTCQTSF